MQKSSAIAEMMAAMDYSGVQRCCQKTQYAHAQQLHSGVVPKAFIEMASNKRRYQAQHRHSRDQRSNTIHIHFKGFRG